MPHQHCILADRRASAVALGKDSNDDSVGDLLAGNRTVGGPRSQYPLKHFLLEILDNKARTVLQYEQSARVVRVATLL